MNLVPFYRTKESCKKKFHVCGHGVLAAGVPIMMSRSSQMVRDAVRRTGIMMAAHCQVDPLQLAARELTMPA